MDYRPGTGFGPGTLGGMTSAVLSSPPPASPLPAEAPPQPRTVALAVGGHGDERDDVRRALARLAVLDAPHLAPLRRIAEDPQGFLLTHAVAPGAVSWAELVGRRAATSVETVTLGLALCQALGALHAAGLAHGAVAADTIVVSPTGRIELVDTGSAWSVPPGSVRAGRAGPTAAADVAALVAVLEPGFGPVSLGADLALLLVRGADPDPAQRPAVGRLGEALERAGRAEPVNPGAFGTPATAPPPIGAARTGSPATEPPPTKPSTPGTEPEVAVPPVRGRSRPLLWRARSARLLLLVLAAVMGVVLMLQGAVGLLRAGAARPASGPDPAAPGAPVPAPAPRLGPDPAAASTAGRAGVAPGPAATDWASVLGSLDAGRAAAIAAGSPTRLAQVVDPLGPAYARDVVALRARTQAGLRLVGGRLQVRSATVRQTSADQVVLSVVDIRGPYRLVDPAGAVVFRGPARAAATWRVVLALGPTGGWRTHEATRTGD